MGQEDKGEEEEEEWGKVNGKGYHDVPESGGAWGGGSLGETLGQRTLLEEQRKAHCSKTETQWVVTDLQCMLITSQLYTGVCLSVGLSTTLAKTETTIGWIAMNFL